MCSKHSSFKVIICAIGQAVGGNCYIGFFFHNTVLIYLFKYFWVLMQRKNSFGEREKKISKFILVRSMITNVLVLLIVHSLSAIICAGQNTARTSTR